MGLCLFRRLLALFLSGRGEIISNLILHGMSSGIAKRIIGTDRLETSMVSRVTC